MLATNKFEISENGNLAVSGMSSFYFFASDSVNQTVNKHLTFAEYYIYSEHSYIQYFV